MSDIQLTDCSYDVIISGTSLVNTIIAAACAKQSIKVLHIDASDQYGSFNQSINLADYVDMCRSHGGPLRISDTDNQSITEEQINQWNLIVEQSFEKKIQPDNQSTNQSADQSTDQSADQSLNQSINQSTNQSADQAVDHSIDKSADQATEEQPSKEQSSINQSIDDQSSINQSSEAQSTEAESAPQSKKLVLRDLMIDRLSFQPITDSSNTAFHSAVLSIPEPLVTDTVNQSLTQSINQSTDQTNPSQGEETNQSSDNLETTQSADQPTEQPLTQSTSQSSKSLLDQSRKFSIDLSPSLLLTRSSLVDLLIASFVSHYIDFQAVDAAFICFPPNQSINQSVNQSITLEPLPISTSQLLSCHFLSLSEKRGLRRIIESIIPTHHMTDKQKAESSQLIEEFGSMPFIKFLQSKSKSEKVIDFVLYAIAQASHNPSINQSNNQSANQLTTSEAVERIKLYLSSINRFSPGAHLSPMYGLGELPQGFARLAAVHGADYILRFKPQALVLESINQSINQSTDQAVNQSADQSVSQSTDQQFAGIISPGNQFLRANHFVGSSLDFPLWTDQSINQSINQSISCAVIITDAPLRSADGTANEETLVIIMPQQSINQSNNQSINPSINHPVRLIQLGSSVHAAPSGMYVMHFTTPRINGAEADLKSTVELLTSTNQSINQSINEKPNLLFSSYYERTPVHAQSNLPKNVYLTSMTSSLDSYDVIVSEAEKIFSKICPTVSLVDALKHIDDKRIVDEQLEALDELDLIIAAASKSTKTVNLSEVSATNQSVNQSMSVSATETSNE